MQAQDLYGLPLDRFIPERGALAKALRAEGRRDEAARVARLRKPSLAAWAVNQLIRTQASAVNDLFEAGDALQHAQSELLEGRGDARGMREAGVRERSAVDALTEVARGLLSSDGHELTQTTLERVSETLHAAAFDDQARGQVRDGCLEKELRHVGLGGAWAVGAPATPRAPAHGARERDPARERDRARQRDRARAPETDHTQARERTEQRDAARRAEAESRRLAERATRELNAAQRRRDRADEALRKAADALRDAEDALRAAENALSTAGDRAQETELAHRRTQQALDGF